MAAATSSTWRVAATRRPDYTNARLIGSCSAPPLNGIYSGTRSQREPGVLHPPGRALDAPTELLEESHMKARNEGQVPAPTLSPWALLFGVGSALVAMACTGVIGDQGQSPGGAPTGGAAAGGGPVVVPRVTGDVGRVSIHRLNNLEYDNTLRDLLGVDGMAQKTFQPDEEGEFDNDADA